MVHLRHPGAQGSEILHGLAAVIIIQVALERVLHSCQVHVWHCCSIGLLQRAADLLYKVPNLPVHQMFKCMGLDCCVLPMTC